MYPRIRDLREDADMTQAEMARLLFCSQQAYDHYEQGIRDIPTDVLIRIADIHHTTTDYLLSRTNYRTVPVCFGKQ